MGVSSLVTGTPSPVSLLSALTDGVDPVATDERGARRTLRGQIARLEAELADTVVTGFAVRHPGRISGDPALGVPAHGPARLLGLGELELVRDDLARRVRQARDLVEARTREQAARRVELEAMQLEPGRHRFAEISRRELGEPGCGVYRVRPRLGLLGMLMGWWEVKLSSGCPLAGRRGPRVRAARHEGRC